LVVVAVLLFLSSRIPAYTLSLSLWGVPVLAMMLFLHQAHRMDKEVQQALWIALGSIFVLGSALDLLFAHLFFTFPNPQAVLGLRIRGIPVEEFGFYLLGGWFIALGYVFCDQWWLVRYNRSATQYRRWARQVPALVLPRPGIWIWFLALAIAGIVFKRAVNPQGMAVPGYFLFLLVGAYVPTFLVWRVVEPFLNFRAFSLTLSVTLGISLLWEATLALPLGWWGYQEGAMLGVFVAAWHRLPLEAVTVWFFSLFAALVYETAKLAMYRRSQGLGALGRRG
jgi:hypothetical protein